MPERDPAPEVRAGDPEERRRLLLRAAWPLVAMLGGFTAIDLLRGSFWIALAEGVFAGGLAWMARALARDRDARAVERAERVGLASSLPIFFSCLLDPGLGHASVAALPLGPVAWYAMGGARQGRLAAGAFLGVWAALAAARLAGATPFGPWRYSWADWGGMLAMWLLSAMIMDWRERGAEERRAAFLAEEAAMRAFLERIPVAVGVVREGQWLFCNTAMRGLCGGCATEIARFIGEEAWLALLRHGEVRADWETGEAPRPVRILAVEGRWGRRDAWMVIVVDESEARELDRLRREEMLAALAGGVAHHFNNLLMSVMGAADLVMQSRELGEAHRHGRAIAAAAARGAGISRTLAAFARSRPGKIEHLRPDAFLARQAPVLELLATDGVRVAVHAEPELPAIMADRRDLEEMLLRLVRNAVEAAPPDSVVHVSAARMEIRELAGWLGPGEPGEHVVFSVTNRGEIGTTTIRRALVPFYSSHGPRRAGLGLNVVMAIARRHRALVRVHASEAHGRTEVDVAFPARRLAFRVAGRQGA